MTDPPHSTAGFHSLHTREQGAALGKGGGDAKFLFLLHDLSPAQRERVFAVTW